MSEIGSGGQAYVKEAIDMDTNEHVAIKIYKKSQMNFKDLNKAYLENEISRSLQDPTIIPNIGYFEDQEYICLIFELMHANLRALLSKDNLREDILSEVNVCKMFKKMVEAVAVCHRSNIIHRDIKLENFLVKSCAESDELDIRLSDFGIACKYSETCPPSAKKGSVAGVAPEILT